MDFQKVGASSKATQELSLEGGGGGSEIMVVTRQKEASRQVHSAALFLCESHDRGAGDVLVRRPFIYGKLIHPRLTRLSPSNTIIKVTSMNTFSYRAW